MYSAETSGYIRTPKSVKRNSQSHVGASSNDVQTRESLCKPLNANNSDVEAFRNSILMNDNGSSE